MRLLVCVYEDVDAERVLVDELSDLDEAVACSRDLVESDGYPRAEVWSAAGRRLFVVTRDGNAIHEGEHPDEAALFESLPPSRTVHRSRGRRADAPPPERTDAPVIVADGLATPEIPVTPPSPPASSVPDGLLGEQTNSAERWFGV